MKTNSYKISFFLIGLLVALAVGVSCSKGSVKTPKAIDKKKATVAAAEPVYKPKQSPKVVGIEQKEIIDFNKVFFDGVTDLRKEDKANAS